MDLTTTRYATERIVADVNGNGVKTVIAEPGEPVSPAYLHLIPEDKLTPGPGGTAPASDDAKKKAKKTIDDAKKKAKKELDDAEAQAKKLIEGATAEAEQIVAVAKAEAAEQQGDAGEPGGEQGQLGGTAEGGE